MAKRFSLILVAFLLFSSSAYAEGPYNQFSVGGWDVGAYTYNKTGEFSHCAASAEYKSGILFLVSVDVSGSWTLGFLHESWQLSPGETIPIELVFDNRKKFHVFGEVVDPQFVKVPMPVDSELIRQFRWAREMDALAKGYLYGFNLTDTSKLLPALVRCMTANRGKFGPRSTSTTASNAQPDVTGLPPLAPELQVEAIGLATNFMLGAQLNNPRVLTKAETPAQLAPLGVAWSSDEAVGAVMIIPPSSEIKGLDVTTAFAQGLSTDCKGKFVSGRNSELVDSEVVFQGVATCEDADGLRTTNFFVVPRQPGGFVIFSVVSSPLLGDGADGETSSLEEADLGGYQRAALTAAGNR